MAATSPLAPVLDLRHNGFGLAVAEGPADGPGWHEAGDASGLEERLELAHAALGASLRGVAAAALLEKHAWHVASLVVAGLLIERALPPLGPDAVQLLDGPYGWADAIAVPPSGWTHDPAPEAVAAALEAHLAPAVAALAHRRPARALWREAGDRLGQAVIWCGEALGDRGRAWALGTALLEAPTRLQAPAGFGLDAEGAPFRRRSGCCLSYRCPDIDLCPDCPLRR